MKNFKGRNQIEKRTWGILGKQETFFSPAQFVKDEEKPKENPLLPWNSKTTKHRRFELIPKFDVQQGGVVSQETPVPSPTSTSTPTPTQTPSSTPSSMPTPALWYDATNLGSIDYITSGDTDYITNLRSIGSASKTLTASTVNTPAWYNSSIFPNTPKVIRLSGSTTTTSQDWLTQRFDSSQISFADGMTVFMVFAKPSGATYDRSTSGANGFGLTLRLMSGNTTTGGWASVTDTQILLNYNGQASNSTVTTVNTNGSANGFTFPFSATNLTDKFLQTAVYDTVDKTVSVMLNGTSVLSSGITSTLSTGRFNQVSLGLLYTTTGASSFVNNNAEVGEIMIFNQKLTPSQITDVETYLKDKWDYSGWIPATPTPTPTNTQTPTTTPTPTTTSSPTPTTTSSPTPTPSSSPVPFVPSSISNLQHWYDASGATVSSWSNQGLLGGSLLQGTASLQPQVVNGNFFGTYTGNLVQFLSRDNFVGTFADTNYSSSTIFIVGGMTLLGADENKMLQLDNVFGVSSYNNLFETIKNPSTIRTNTTDSITLGGGIQLFISSGTTGVSYDATWNNPAYTITGTKTSSTATSTTTTLRIGLNPGTSTNSNIYLYEILIYNKILSPTELTNVSDYLKTKYEYTSW
jgi:hypothetical protein